MLSVAEFLAPPWAIARLGWPNGSAGCSP